MSAIVANAWDGKIIQWDGNVITRPGIYAGVPMHIYHGQLTDTPSISSSGLRKINQKTLKHFWDQFYLNPEAEPVEPSEAMIFGRAIHHLFTAERERFFDLFAIRPDTYPDDDSKKWNANSKSCKAWLAARKREGRDVLSGAQLENIKGMAREVASHHLVQQGSLHGLVEHTIVWRDPITGVWLKSRPDNLHLLTQITVVDLKTCEDASWDACSRALTDHDLHMQLSLTRMGLQALTGQVPSGYDLLFVEKRRPFVVAQRPVADLSLDYALRELRRSINAFAIALEKHMAGEPAHMAWPGYEVIDEDRPLNLTNWRMSSLAKEAENKTLPLRDDPPWRPSIPDQRDPTSAEAVGGVS